MNTRSSLRLSSSALLLLALTTAGCAAVGGAVAGAAIAFGAIKYRNNRAEVHYEKPINQVWEATIAGLEAAGYNDARQNAKLSGNEGEIEVGNVGIDVSARSTTVTRIRLRVGTFETDEHKAEANRILKMIGDRIG